jgi:hypothetical protein
MIQKVGDTQMILDYFAPVEGGINLIYGHVGNGKTYCATEQIIQLARRGHVVWCNWKIDVEDFDQRKSFVHILVHLFLFKKRFLKFPLQENIKYLDPDEMEIADISPLANCHVYIDEGQWILDSYEGTKFSKEKRKAILHTRHYNRTLNIVTQRPTSIHVSARGNVERYFKCVKVMSWPFLLFRRYEYQDMTNETVDETEPISTKLFFAKKSVMRAYNTLAMRGEDAIEQEVHFEAWDYGFWDRIKLFFGYFRRFVPRLRLKPKGEAQSQEPKKMGT